MLKIGVKYCGGCNPEIDRSAVVEGIYKGLKKSGREIVLVTDKETKIDILLLVNGCQHACLEEEYPIFEEGVPVISIRGAMVGNRYVREEDIPGFLAEKLEAPFTLSTNG